VKIDGTRLTFVELAAPGSSGVRWVVRCECGVTKTVNKCDVRSGRTKSCGCLNRERVTTHGERSSLEYSSWMSMKRRCLYENDPAYRRYGGAGITICERWLGDNGFQNFLSDMGRRPTPDHTLDRYPNPAGNYAPENCRWATKKEQGRNRRDSRLLTVDGVTRCISEWTELLGAASDHTIVYRLNRGWSAKDAVSVPPGEER
jgi:hypothetical protein